MSEPERRSENDGAGADPGRPEARLRLLRRPLWVWLVPLAAAGMVGWLLIQGWIFGGSSIVVHAADARGVEKGAAVRYRGVKVGTVAQVRLGEQPGRVELVLSMDHAVSGMLRAGTRFWLVEPRLGTGPLTSLVSGGHVAMEPGDGEPADEFTALERPPVVEATAPGKTFVLLASGAGSLSLGSIVRFRGVEVGRVQGVELDGDGVAIHVFVPEPFDRHVRSGSRFWRVGISLGSGGGLALSVPPLGALLGGGVDFDTPDVLAGPEASAGTRFRLYESAASAAAAMPGSTIPYAVHFTEPLDGLESGAPVEVLGARVGRVRDVQLRPLTDGQGIASRVVIEIDAQRLGLEVTPQSSQHELRERVNDVLKRLVANGMRVRLSGGLLPGTASVSLVMASDPEQAAVDFTDTELPVLPSAPGGAGLSSAISAIGAAAPEVAEHVRRITRRIDELVQDPAIDRSLANVEQAVSDLQTTAAKLENMLGGPIRQGRGLADLIEEVTRTALAVRELASVLTRHPEALLTGREGDR